MRGRCEAKEQEKRRAKRIHVQEIIVLLMSRRNRVSERGAPTRRPALSSPAAAVVVNSIAGRPSSQIFSPSIRRRGLWQRLHMQKTDDHGRKKRKDKSEKTCLWSCINVLSPDLLARYSHNRTGESQGVRKRATKTYGVGVNVRVWRRSMPLSSRASHFRRRCRCSRAPPAATPAAGLFTLRSPLSPPVVGLCLWRQGLSTTCVSRRLERKRVRVPDRDACDKEKRRLILQS